MFKLYLFMPTLLAFSLSPAHSVPCRADEIPEDAPHEVVPGETTDSLHDLNDKLTQSRAVPYFENGQPAGYRSADAAPDTQLENGAEPNHAFQMTTTGMITNRRIDTVTTESEDDSTPPQSE